MRVIASVSWAAGSAAKMRPVWERSPRCSRVKRASPCAWATRARKNWVTANGATRPRRIFAWGSNATARITAIDATSALNTGPYAPGYGVASRLGHGLTYLYSCPNARFVGKVAYTNSPVAGSYRGLGAPQAHFALESFADEVAEKLRMDPLEFRLRHCVGPKVNPARG